MAAIAQHYDEDRPRAGISATEATTWRATGAYTMGAQLGSGGFGSVFVGWSDLGERVALKAADAPDALRRLDHEARLLARVAGHANVVALVGRFDRGLALEFCGVELFEYFFHSGGFEEAAAASYAGQLFSGVAHCHGRGVFHRDVKPENLLLSEHLQLKIVDFGLGAVDDGRPLTDPCGTAGYMAPEILGACERGAAACYDGAPADCWSCAVVAFLLCKGAPPLTAASSRDPFFAALAGNRRDAFWAGHAPFAPTRRARRFLDGALVVSPRKRPAAAAALRDAWILEESLPPDELRAAMRKRADAVTAATRRVSSAADDDAPPLFRGASDGSEAREVSLMSDEFLDDDACGDVYRSLDVPEDAPRRSLAAVRAPRALVGALLPAAAAALGALGATVDAEDATGLTATVDGARLRAAATVAGRDAVLDFGRVAGCTVAYHRLVFERLLPAVRAALAAPIDSPPGPP